MPKNLRQNVMTMKQPAPNRNILILFMVTLLGSLSVSLTGPIWAFYVSSLEASEVEVGYVFGISNAMAAMANILGGSLSDRYGRKKPNAIGTLLSVFPPILYLFAKNWVGLIPWVVISGLGTGLCMPIRWSIIADSSADRKRAMAYSWINLAFLLGSTVAPILGGLIADAFGMRLPFILSFGLMGASFIFSLFLHESRKATIQQSVTTGDNAKSQPFLAITLILCALNVIQAIGIGIYGPITPLFTGERFSATYADVGILYAIGFGLSSMVVQIPGGKIATRYDRKKIVIVTIILSAPFFGLFALSRSFVECIIVMFLSNVILNFSWPAYQDLMMALSPPSRRGLITGISNTSFWCGMMIGSTISGILWEKFGMPLPYYISAVMVLLSALPVLFLKETSSKA
jgi:MFS family permease